MQIEMIDYSQPPPGYRVYQDEGTSYWSGAQTTWELGSTQATRENSTGYRIVGRIGAKTNK
jgi:hypothetical protein